MPAFLSEDKGDCDHWRCTGKFGRNLYLGTEMTRIQTDNPSYLNITMFKLAELGGSNTTLDGMHRKSVQCSPPLAADQFFFAALSDLWGRIRPTFFLPPMSSKSPLRDLSTGLFAEWNREWSRIALLAENSSPQAIMFDFENSGEGPRLSPKTKTMISTRENYTGPVPKLGTARPFPHSRR